MTDLSLPWLIEVDQMEAVLDHPSILLLDMGSKEDYQKGHLPRAIHCEYDALVSGVAPAKGKLPGIEKLNALFSALGLDDNKHVIAYDHENNAKAGRILWTLDVIGHSSWSMLNGGFTAWVNQEKPVQYEPITAESTNYRIDGIHNAIADSDFILHHLDDSDIAILDARTPEEYAGIKSPSKRHGHIPGAVNLNWLDTIDEADSHRLKSPDVLQSMLKDRNITPDKTVIVHCQTHHRSSHSYVMLKSLDFDKIRGYDGSWSEWGNDPDLPIETGY